MPLRAPAVTQEFVCGASATRIAGFQTLISRVRRVIWRHALTIGFRWGTQVPLLESWSNALASRAAAAGLYSEKLEIARGEISTP
jgi:hypothetical protein